MQVVVLEDDSVLNFTVGIEAKDGFSNVSGGKFVELLEIERGNLTTNLRGDSRASVTDEIFHVKDADLIFSVLLVENELPVVGELELKTSVITSLDLEDI